MKRLMIFGLLSCMSFGQASAIEIELVLEPTLGQKIGFFMENVSDAVTLHPNRAKSFAAVFAVGAGYVSASYADCLPSWIPSVSKMKQRIRKAWPEQTPIVIATECVLGLAVAYLLQDVPAFIGSWFENPCEDF